MSLFNIALKKTRALVVANEANFVLGQQLLSEQKLPAIVINLSTTTFKIVGRLTDTHIKPLIDICQEVLLTLSFFNPAFGKSDSRMNNPASHNTKQKELVEKTCEYLRINLQHPLTIHDICRVMHTNRNTLSQAFKQELDIGVSGWLRNQRMEKAHQLLLDTDMSVQEISERVGYPVQANFSTTFKNRFKQSPLQIRRSGNQSSNNKNGR